MKPSRWSYSSLSMYEECPRKWRYAYVDKLPQPPSPAMERGTQMHKLCEDVLTGALREVPPELQKVEKTLHRMRQREAQAEAPWRLDAAWQPVAEKSWVLAIVDVHFRVDETLHVYDFKTGRAYPSHAKQLELYSLIGMAIYPEVQSVQSGAVYLDAGKFGAIRTMTREQMAPAVADWTRRAQALYADEALEAKPGRGCYWCAFKDIAGGPCIEWRNK